jgi:predicted transcriptional regulator
MAVTEIKRLAGDIPADLHDRVSTIAKQRERSVAYIMREAVREYVERHEADEARAA